MSAPSVKHARGVGPGGQCSAAVRRVSRAVRDVGSPIPVSAPRPGWYTTGERFRSVTVPAALGGGDPMWFDDPKQLHAPAVIFPIDQADLIALNLRHDPAAEVAAPSAEKNAPPTPAVSRVATVEP